MAEFYVRCGRRLPDGSPCPSKTLPQITFDGHTILWCPTCRAETPVPRRRRCRRCQTHWTARVFCDECETALAVLGQPVEILTQDASPDDEPPPNR